jgi:ABC-type transport system involved in Fe-S cluster assembly fused permease/ATPase subunit
MTQSRQIPDGDPPSGIAPTLDPILAVIPARGGSKGLPGKNLRTIAGLPLIGHALRCAQRVPRIARTIVSTDSEEIAAAARAVGAESFIGALPDGYDTEVGERGVQLSAGQRQLIAFARALVADPRILVLDEATSNVDVRTEGLIEQGLRRLLAGRTAIVIAHRLSTIRHASTILVLDHGRIVEQGSHEELLDAGGRYWDLYRDWAERAVAA